MGYFISAGIATVDTPLKLGELFEPMSVPAAVTQLFFMMAYGVVEVYVAIYAVLHCLPSEGIYFIGIAVAGTCGGKSGEARLVYTGNAAIITGILLLVFAHNIPCCCGSTAGIQFRSCAVCPADHGHACRKTRCRKLYVFRGFRFRDCIGRILAGLLVKYRGYDDMFLGMLLVLLLSIVLHYLFGRRHPSSSPPPKKKEYGMNRITRKSDIFGRICFKPTYLF